MRKIHVNFVITLSIVGLMTAAIIYLMGNSLFTVNWFSTNYLNRTMAYQASTLALSLVIVLVTAFQTEFQSLRLLSLTRIDGKVLPEPWIGITKRNKDSWKKLGRNMAIVISIVTAVAIYFQVIQKGVIQTLTLASFLSIILFALTNSFVEETTYRHTFASIVEYHGLSPHISKALSALIFGGGSLSGHTRENPRRAAGRVPWLVPVKKRPRNQRVLLGLADPFCTGRHYYDSLVSDIKLGMINSGQVQGARGRKNPRGAFEKAPRTPENFNS